MTRPSRPWGPVPRQCPGGRAGLCECVPDCSPAASASLLFSNAATSRACCPRWSSTPVCHHRAHVRERRYAEPVVPQAAVGRARGGVGDGTVRMPGAARGRRAAYPARPHPGADEGREDAVGCARRHQVVGVAGRRSSGCVHVDRGSAEHGSRHPGGRDRELAAGGGAYRTLFGVGHVFRRAPRAGAPPGACSSRPTARGPGPGRRVTSSARRPRGCFPSRCCHHRRCLWRVVRCRERLGERHLSG